MDNPQRVFDLLKRHLEFKDNWGNNPYLPKEKADALLIELQAVVSEIYEQGKKVGAKYAVVGLVEDFQKAIGKQKEATKLSDEEWGSIRSFMNWKAEREF